MSEQSDENPGKRSIGLRVVWGVLYLIVAYVSVFAFLLIDGRVFDGKLFFHPVVTGLRIDERLLNDVLETIYYPLIKPLLALDLL